MALASNAMALVRAYEGMQGEMLGRMQLEADALRASQALQLLSEQSKLAGMQIPDAPQASAMETESSSSSSSSSSPLTKSSDPYRHQRNLKELASPTAQARVPSPINIASLVRDQMIQPSLLSS
jgi:hypothetical protein